jgi:hypothetical protein
MKRLTFSRKQILRAIHAACVALFFASMQTAPADWSINGGAPVPDAKVTSGNNSIVGSGTFSGYVLGSGGTDTVTVESGADITYGGANVITLGTGSVNNAGTLTASGDYDGVYIGGNASVTNSGSISTTGSDYVYGIDIQNGSIGNDTITLTNTSTGSIYGYQAGIKAVNDNGFSSGNVSSSITLTNIGGVANSISGYYNGAILSNTNSFVGGNASNTIDVINSGYIASNHNGSALQVSNANADIGENASNAIVLMNSGNIYNNGGDNTINLLNSNTGIGGSASNSITITNSASDDGIQGADDGISAMNTNDGVGVNSNNAITLTNTGSIYGKNQYRSLPL